MEEEGGREKRENVAVQLGLKKPGKGGRERGKEGGREGGKKGGREGERDWDWDC